MAMTHQLAIQLTYWHGSMLVTNVLMRL